VGVLDVCFASRLGGEVVRSGEVEMDQVALARARSSITPTAAQELHRLTDTYPRYVSRERQASSNRGTVQDQRVSMNSGRFELHIPHHLESPSPEGVGGHNDTPSTGQVLKAVVALIDRQAGSASFQGAGE
jgi:hypothetical protein